MSTIETGAVHHVTLTVTDVKRSAEFYSNYLGFQVAAEFEMKPGVPRAALSNGGTMLVLTVPPDAARAITGDQFNENRIGLDHISLAVKDKAALEAAAAFLDENGITRGEIRDLGAGFAIFVMAVRDPDNIQLELMAPYPG